jgi:cell surface protein SprA
MNTINAYYEYSIDVMPNMEVGQKTSLILQYTSNSCGEITDARWIQFKIPVSQPENTIGNISDLDQFDL